MPKYDNLIVLSLTANIAQTNAMLKRQEMEGKIMILDNNVTKSSVMYSSTMTS